MNRFDKAIEEWRNGGPPNDAISCIEPLVMLINEAADELAFMHRLCMERYRMDEPIGRVVRLLYEIQKQTGHVTESPYPKPSIGA